MSTCTANVALIRCTEDGSQDDHCLPLPFSLSSHDCADGLDKLMALSATSLHAETAIFQAKLQGPRFRGKPRLGARALKS